MQDRLCELKERTEIFLQNLREIIELIKTRSDLRFVERCIENLQIEVDNESCEDQQSEQY